MSGLAMVLFTWDGEKATINLGALLLVVAIVAMVWGMFRG